MYFSYLLIRHVSEWKTWYMYRNIIWQFCPRSPPTWVLAALFSNLKIMWGGPPCSASACVVSHAAHVFGIIGNCVSNQIWLDQPLQFSVLEKLTIVLEKSSNFDLIKLYEPCEPFLVTYLIWIQLSSIDCTSQWLYKYKLEQSWKRCR